MTQADGSIQHYRYNEAHELYKIFDDLGNTIEYIYDPRGNRIEEKAIDPNADLESSIVTTYNARNFVETINRGGALTTNTYDATGQINTLTNPNQIQAADYDYDDLDRLSSIVDALTNTTSYQYDVADNLTQVTAPNNATTDYEYDDHNQLSLIHI